jgi:PQQ-dependent catabolism-associated CXXCW motif protein
LREAFDFSRQAGDTGGMLHASVIGLLLAALVAGQCAAQGLADEERDWGVAPPDRIRAAPYTAPTPTTIPGATVISTRLLNTLAAGAAQDRPVLVDVASGEGHATLPGAVWIPGAGRGTSFVDPLQARFIELMARLTGGDKARPLVYFCVNSRCWLSYNAALRAVAAGYSRVYWYRGGLEAWRAAGLPLVAIEAAAQ